MYRLADFARTEKTAKEFVAPPPFSEIAASNLSATYAEGDSMSPVIDNGNLVWVCEASADETIREGTRVVALAEGMHGPVIRMFCRGKGCDWLLAENFDYRGEPKLRCERVLGIVVARASRIRWGD